MALLSQYLTSMSASWWPALQPGVAFLRPQRRGIAVTILLHNV